MLWRLRGKLAFLFHEIINNFVLFYVSLFCYNLAFMHLNGYTGIFLSSSFIIKLWYVLINFKFFNSHKLPEPSRWCNNWWVMQVEFNRILRILQAPSLSFRWNYFQGTQDWTTKFFLSYIYRLSSFNSWRPRNTQTRSAVNPFIQSDNLNNQH